MNDFKAKYYRLAKRTATERQLAALLFRAYSKNPVEAYKILNGLPNARTKKRLLKYIDRLHSKKAIIEFVGFYMLHRVTLQNNPRLKNIYWQNNLSLLYPDLPQKEARLKALRTVKHYQYDDNNIVPTQTVEKMPVKKTNTKFQILIDHIRSTFENLK